MSYDQDRHLNSVNPALFQFLKATGFELDRIEYLREGGPDYVVLARLNEHLREALGLIGDELLVMALHQKEQQSWFQSQIASRLHIAIHTVKSHVHNVLEKLALHTRLEVAAFTRGVDNPKPPNRAKD